MEFLSSKRRLNTREAAQYLGIRPGTMEVWRSLGRGPRFCKIGARVVYNITDLDEYAQSCVVETIDTVNTLKGGSHA
ncbi:helix-turn-helix domain-containing protein [Desulfobulbus elongatus]|uniref:helix-turn-helix domain-containing protein n=1 Tax=Desulfobulbus elongatus TaxID=53332 RepID=UPI000A045CE2